MNAHVVLVAAIATVGLNSPDNLVNDQVDRIEVNHVYDGQGNHVFDQLIFFEWSPSESRFHVRAWRLLRKRAQFPLRDHRNGMYEAVWHDGTTLRRVRSRAFSESWTQYDLELKERNHLPRAQRRKLTPVGNNPPKP